MKTSKKIAFVLFALLTNLSLISFANTNDKSVSLNGTWVLGDINIEIHSPDGEQNQQQIEAIKERVAGDMNSGVFNQLVFWTEDNTYGADLDKNNALGKYLLENEQLILFPTQGNVSLPTRYIEGETMLKISYDISHIVREMGIISEDAIQSGKVVIIMTTYYSKKVSEF